MSRALSDLRLCRASHHIDADEGSPAGVARAEFPFLVILAHHYTVLLHLLAHSLVELVANDFQELVEIVASGHGSDKH